MADPKPKKKVNIYEKIFNIQTKLKTVLKTGKNTFQHYDYATEADFINEIKPLLTEQKLVLITSTVNHTLVERLHTVEVQFMLVNTEDEKERIETTFYGSGEDKAGSVVGLPIAYTMAMKYFLAKTFIAETGTDAENDGASGEGKGKTKGKETTEKKVDYDAVVRMISTSRNADGLVEYAMNKLPKSKAFNAKQKKDLNTLLNKRVDELTKK